MPIMYSEGAMSFLNANQVFYKDAKAWFQTHTSRLIESIKSAVMKDCGSSIIYLSSSKTRKEAVAHQRQQELEVESELIGAWSCVEAGNSFRIKPAEGQSILQCAQTRCKHIYLYFDHEDDGFMNIRIQTWFPYKIQIAMNRRE